MPRLGRTINHFLASGNTGLRELAEAGVDEVELWPWNRYGVALADLSGKCDSVTRFAEEVIEPLRARLDGGTR